jgi:hypothetical protein
MPKNESLTRFLLYGIKLGQAALLMKVKSAIQQIKPAAKAAQFTGGKCEKISERKQAVYLEIERHLA